MKWCERVIIFGELENPRVKTVMPCRLKGPRRIIKYTNITGRHVHTNSSRGLE
jgi:hypothetical protein